MDDKYLFDALQTLNAENRCRLEGVIYALLATQQPNQAKEGA